MPKRKQGTNCKSEAARVRKADQKAEKSLAEEQARLDAYWQDDDKLCQRKLQRKAEKESRRLEEIEKRAELKKMEATESELLACEAKPKVKVPVRKVTQAEIQEKLASPSHKPSVPMVTDLPLKENVNHTFNRLDPENSVARSVDEAIIMLKRAASPKPNSEATFSKFEKDNLTRIRDSNPTLRMSQVRQILKKEWMRSPENPSNQLGACKF